MVFSKNHGQACAIHAFTKFDAIRQALRTTCWASKIFKTHQRKMHKIHDAMFLIAACARNHWAVATF
jgi:hypothetical protein